MLYQENDWVYVISEDSKEGFIPYRLAIILTLLVINANPRVDKKKMKMKQKCLLQLLRAVWFPACRPCSQREKENAQGRGEFFSITILVMVVYHHKLKMPRGEVSFLA